MSIDSFTIKVDTDLSRDLETQYYELENKCRNIAFLLQKDTRFDNIFVQKQYESLIENIIKYEDYRNRISNEIAIPESIKKWGENHSISWNLIYQTSMLTIIDDGVDKRVFYKNAFEVPSEFSSEMKKLSIENEALNEIYAFIASSYPNIDTSAYNDFIKYRDDIVSRFDNKKRELEREYARQFVENNNIEGMFTWNLKFDTSMVDLTV